MNDKLRLSCSRDLSHPIHPNETLPDRLRAIADFMETSGLAAGADAAEMDIEGTAVNLLEEKVAAITGMQAALFCQTGIMAQAIAARIYARRRANNRVLIHPTAHPVLHEEDGYTQAHGLDIELVGNWRECVSADMLDDNAACAFVELPLRHSGGRLPDWQVLEDLKARAKQLGLPLHMDGARLWSVRPYYDGRSYSDICRGFNSVYVSLYKEIGGLSGAVLAGDRDFIDEARQERTRLGGLLPSSATVVCDALRQMDGRIERTSDFVKRASELVDIVKSVTSVKIDPDPPHANMFHIMLPASVDRCEQARDATAKETGVWLTSRFWDYEGPELTAMEIIVGEKWVDIPNEMVLNAFSHFMDQLGLKR